jgi:hypothetical protein
MSGVNLAQHGHFSWAPSPFKSLLILVGGARRTREGDRQTYVTKRFTHSMVTARAATCSSAATAAAGCSAARPRAATQTFTRFGPNISSEIEDRAGLSRGHQIEPVRRLAISTDTLAKEKCKTLLIGRFSFRLHEDYYLLCAIFRFFYILMLLSRCG